MSKQEEIDTLKLQIGKLDKQLAMYEKWRSESLDKKTYLVEKLRILEEEAHNELKIKHIQSFKY